MSVKYKQYSAMKVLIDEGEHENGITLNTLTKGNFPLCQVNGEYILTDDWDKPLNDCEVTMHGVLQEPFSSIGTAATIAVYLLYGAAGAAAVYAGYKAYEWLFDDSADEPRDPAAFELSDPSPTFSRRNQANYVRLGQPIPIIYGHMRVFPDIAGEPYFFFRGNQEWISYLLRIGHGEFEIEQQPGAPLGPTAPVIRIGDTESTQFRYGQRLSDEIYHEAQEGAEINDPRVGGFVKPYDIRALPKRDFTPFDVPEQASMSDTNNWSKDIVINPASTKVDSFYLSFLSRNGQWYIHNNNQRALDCPIYVEWREIDNNGDEVMGSAWEGISFPTSSISTDMAMGRDDAGTANIKYPDGGILIQANGTTAEEFTTTRGITIRYDLPVGKRGKRIKIRLRMGRELPSETRGRPVLYAVRGQNSIRPTYPEDTTYLMIELKATDDNRGGRSKINVDVTRKLKTFDSDGDESTTVTATSSLARALWDIMRNPVYGIGMPANKISASEMKELETFWDANGYEFNHVFDRQYAPWDILKQMGKAGRSAPLLRWGELTFNRSKQQPQTNRQYFDSTDIISESFDSNPITAADIRYDGVEGRFFNRDGWVQDSYRFNVDGTSVTNPLVMDFPGVTDRTALIKEVKFHARVLKYQTEVVSFDTEMRGLLLNKGQAIELGALELDTEYMSEIVGYDSVNDVILVENPIPALTNAHVKIKDVNGVAQGPHRITYTPNGFAFSINGYNITEDMDTGELTATNSMDSTKSFKFDSSREFNPTAVAIGDSDPLGGYIIRDLTYNGEYRVKVTATNDDPRIHQE